MLQTSWHEWLCDDNFVFWVFFLLLLFEHAHTDTLIWLDILFKTHCHVKKKHVKKDFATGWGQNSLNKILKHLCKTMFTKEIARKKTA